MLYITLLNIILLDYFTSHCITLAVLIAYMLVDSCQTIKIWIPHSLRALAIFFLFSNSTLYCVNYLGHCLRVHEHHAGILANVEGAAIFGSNYPGLKAEFYQTTNIYHITPPILSEETWPSFCIHLAGLLHQTSTSLFFPVTPRLILCPHWAF